MKTLIAILLVALVAAPAFACPPCQNQNNVSQLLQPQSTVVQQGAAIVNQPTVTTQQSTVLVPQTNLVTSYVPMTTTAQVASLSTGVQSYTLGAPVMYGTLGVPSTFSTLSTINGVAVNPLAVQNAGLFGRIRARRPHGTRTTVKTQAF